MNLKIAQYMCTMCISNLQSSNLIMVINRVKILLLINTCIDMYIYIYMLNNYLFFDSEFIELIFHNI